MVDVSGIQQQVQKIAEQALKEQTKSGGLDKGAANAQDVEKMQAALNQPPAETTNAVQQTQGTQGADKVQGIQSATNESPGAKILQHMDGLRSGMKDAMNELQSVISKPEMSTAELFKAQAKLQEITMQQELLSKGVSKSEEHLNQMLKPS
jgi:hypothetical protein